MDPGMRTRIHAFMLCTSLLAASTASAQERTYFVGVIPESSGRVPDVARDCPAGASLVTFHFDNESYNNANDRSGWKGATRSDDNTTLYLCRVDGRMFKPLAASASDFTKHYVVVQLGTHCPVDSTPFYRYFDNEDGDSDTPNTDYFRTSSNDPDDYGPNFLRAGGGIEMFFCLFRNGSARMSEFPNLGVPYGVFAPDSFSKKLQSGWVLTDDEDDTNNNDYDGDEDARRIISPVSRNDRNTQLNMVKVTPSSCTAGSQVPAMTGNSTPSGLVTWSGALDRSYEGWQAFDASDSTMWISEQNPSTAWLNYQFLDGPRTIQSYAITFKNGTLTSRAPSAWTLEGWDGARWSVVDRRTAERNWLGSERREYAVRSPGLYRQYRLNVTDDNASAPAIVVISLGKLELYGTHCR
jgi:hypothetical protein